MGGVNGKPTWDILIASIVHRTGMLELLLNELGRQLVPGVGVRVFRDNLETKVGEKRQRLVDSSSADYVSFVDDDDMVNQRYVSTIVEALEQRPDYVGFHVYYTEDGLAQLPAYHSLTHGGWFDTDEGLYRDLSHLNPIRRELAVRSEWSGGLGEDVRWAAGLRRLGCVKTEVWVDNGPMYWYRHRRNDGLSSGGKAIRNQMANPPPQPNFDFVTWVT